jgi:hypothetical protein
MMASESDVSVLIPTYRRRDMVGKAVASALALACSIGGASLCRGITGR